MAEKNTESTAVNQLIELVATAKPLPPDPMEDVMFKERPAPRSKTTKTLNAVAGAPRVASGTQQGMRTLPAPKPAPASQSHGNASAHGSASAHGNASAHGSQTLGPSQTIKAMPPAVRTPPVPVAARAPGPSETIKAVPPGVRMSTAPAAVSRAMSVPPLTLDYADDEAAVTNPGPSTLSRATSQGMPAASAVAAVTAAAAPANRPTKPSLPPPHPTLRASSPPAAPVGPATRPSLDQTLDFSYPVVPTNAAPETLDPTDAVIAEVLARRVPAEPAQPAEHAEVEIPRVSSAWIDTQQLAKKRSDWKTTVGRLIGPMVVLAIVGIFVGGYFAFDGDGGKQDTNAAASPSAAKADVASGTKADVASGTKADVASGTKADVASGTKPDVASGTTTDVASGTTADKSTSVVPPNLASSTTAGTTTTGTTTGSTMTGSTMTGSTTTGSTPTGSTPTGSTTTGSTTTGSTTTGTTTTTTPSTTTARTTTGTTTTGTTTTPGTPGVRPMLVDVRIDSTPSGATVTLIDRGKSTYLGTTPVSAAVDNARKYELVFSYENRETHVEKLDPQVTKRVSVKLGRGRAPAAKSRAATVTTGSTTSEPTTTAKSTTSSSTLDTSEQAAADKRAKADKGAKADKSAKADQAAKADRTERAANADKSDKAEKSDSKPEAAAATGGGGGGEGTLMISTKPPCEIFIDGKTTGLTTPQREIKLPAGAHKITLLNEAEGIKKTVSVQITADKPTKVIQDLMK